MTIKIHEDGIDRTATETEIVAITETQEELQASEEAKRAALEIADAKKQEVLTKLGLTSDEAALLLG